MKETINKGCLWLGWNWLKAIDYNFENKSNDYKIIEVFKDKNPNKLLDTEKEFSHYSFIGYDNHKTYKTKIPSRFNGYIKDLKKDRC